MMKVIDTSELKTYIENCSAPSPYKTGMRKLLDHILGKEEPSPKKSAGRRIRNLQLAYDGTEETIDLLNADVAPDELDEEYP